MRCASLCLAIFFTGTSLLGQVKLGESPAPAASPAEMSARVKLGDSPAVFFVTPERNGCPIGITAERRSAPVMSTVGNAPAMPAGQGIKLSFAHALAPNIEQVTVVVHGLSGRIRMIPADSAINNDVEETFQLTRAADAGSLTASYLRPKTIRTTQWIELTSVDYSDGSTWRAKSDGQCTVTPSSFVLVTTR